MIQTKWTTELMMMMMMKKNEWKKNNEIIIANVILEKKTNEKLRLIWVFWLSLLLLLLLFVFIIIGQFEYARFVDCLSFAILNMILLKIVCLCPLLISVTSRWIDAIDSINDQTMENDVSLIISFLFCSFDRVCCNFIYILISSLESQMLCVCMYIVQHGQWSVMKYNFVRWWKAKIRRIPIRCWRSISNFLISLLYFMR